MNIPEYYFYEAKRCDSDDIIQGNLCMTDNKFYIVYDNDFYPSQQGDNIILMADRFFEVNCETIKRVKVKPVHKKYDDVAKNPHYSTHCPNCDNEFKGINEIGFNCKHCGMAIDWN